MRSMVGKIASVDGEAEVIDARGQHHRLVAGDWLREGDRLVTGAGATVAVETTAGEVVQLSESQTMTVSAQISGNYVASASDDAIHPWLLQQVLGAIQSGEDALDISGLLAALPEQGAFAAFAVESKVEQVAPLHIADLIQDHGSASHASAGLVVNEVVDLMASAGLPSEVALQQNLLKDLLKD